MSLWNHLGARNLIALSRQATIRAAVEEAQALYMEGYSVDADRVLDELNDRRRGWKDGWS